MPLSRSPSAKDIWVDGTVDANCSADELNAMAREGLEFHCFLGEVFWDDCGCRRIRVLYRNRNVK